MAARAGRQVITDDQKARDCLVDRRNDTLGIYCLLAENATV